MPKKHWPATWRMCVCLRSLFLADNDLLMICDFFLFFSPDLFLLEGLNLELTLDLVKCSCSLRSSSYHSRGILRCYCFNGSALKLINNLELAWASKSWVVRRKVLIHGYSKLRNLVYPDVVREEGFCHSREWLSLFEVLTFSLNLVFSQFGSIVPICLLRRTCWDLNAVTMITEFRRPLGSTHLLRSFSNHSPFIRVSFLYLNLLVHEPLSPHAVCVWLQKARSQRFYTSRVNLIPQVGSGSSRWVLLHPPVVEVTSWYSYAKITMIFFVKWVQD